MATYYLSLSKLFPDSRVESLGLIARSKLIALLGPSAPIETGLLGLAGLIVYDNSKNILKVYFPDPQPEREPPAPYSYYGE